MIKSRNTAQRREYEKLRKRKKRLEAIDKLEEPERTQALNEFNRRASRDLTWSRW